MAKTLKQKQEIIEQIYDKVYRMKLAIFVNYYGLKVNELQKLRKLCKEQSIDFLVTKKKLSPRLHPRNFDVGEILNKKVSQEIVVAAHRGTGIYVKIMRYDLDNDRWRVLKKKHFKNVPKHKYEIKAKGKTNTVLIKNINTGKVYYKWKVGK